MIISEAEVTSVEQISTTFKFKAKVRALGNSNKDINYMSPYFGHGGAGFVALPTVGQTILVVQPDTTDEFYYLGSVLRELGDSVDNPNILKDDLVSPSDSVDDQAYKARGVPQRLIIKDALGNKIALSNEYNPDYYNVKTQVKSVVGKQFQAVDSPLINSVFLKNEHGDGVTITSTANAVDGARLLKTYANMGQEHRASKGRILMHLLDGRDFTLVNTSTGQNKEFGNDLYGNINIESRNKDVNIYSRSQTTGKIHIECTEPESNQTIQIRTLSGQSVIRISSNGKIELQSGGNLDINVGGDLRLNVGGKLNINAGNGIDMLSSAAINIDGSTIDLNSGTSNPEEPDINPADSAYPIKVET
jgi:hypothetical protein